MKRKTKILIALLYPILIAGTPIGSMAADKIPSPPSKLGISGTVSPIPPGPVTPPGNDGLLSGMTPGNYKIPSGWSIVRTQDFEGTIPGDAIEYWNGSATTQNPHTGSKSLVGSYVADSSAVQWVLEQGYTGEFSEIYLSFWEFTESQARFNDEYMIARFLATKSSSMQDIVYDWMWAPTFNSTDSTLYMVSQGEVTERWGGKTDSVPTGAWHQWEIHLRPNTPGQANGFTRVYLDGALYTSVENKQLFGPDARFTNTPVYAGGFYTKIVWMKDYPNCSIPSGCVSYAERTKFLGTDLCVIEKKWVGQLFSAPKCAPEDPPLPNFKRHIDDVIVMKMTAG
jgi:hypothetical protein